MSKTFRFNSGMLVILTVMRLTPSASYGTFGRWTVAIVPEAVARNDFVPSGHAGRPGMARAPSLRWKSMDLATFADLLTPAGQAALATAAALDPTEEAFLP